MLPAALGECSVAIVGTPDSQGGDSGVIAAGVVTVEDASKLISAA